MFEYKKKLFFLYCVLDKLGKFISKLKLFFWKIELFLVYQKTNQKKLNFLKAFNLKLKKVTSV